MRRFVIAALLLAGCSNCPESGEPPLSDPATWKRYSAEQIARQHFKSRLPDVRIDLESATFLRKPEDMSLEYNANDLNKERWWKVRIVNGATETFSERSGWIGRMLRDQKGLSPD